MSIFSIVPISSISKKYFPRDPFSKSFPQLSSCFHLDIPFSLQNRTETLQQYIKRIIFPSFLLIFDKNFELALNL